MAPKRAAKTQTSTCTHKKLRMTPSINAGDAGFRRPDLSQRKAAMPSSVKSQGKGKRTKLEIGNDSSWPAPLVLPGDALDIDPDDPSQDFQEWMSFYVKHPVTRRRRVVYVAAPPQVDPEVAWCQNWCEPNKKKNIQRSPPLPDLSAVVDFVSAFYQGLPVKLLPPESLHFSQWPDEPVKGGKATQKGVSAVGLNIGHELIRIRTRSCPDRTFGGQMNLNDLIDGAISMLPDDAFALMMVVGQDLYEDDEDEFVCGRAYGGSRVAVISQARYNPALDTVQGVERDHAWPASHCEEYIHSMCEDTELESCETKTKKNGDFASVSGSAAQLVLKAALDAHAALPSLLKTATNSQLTSLWLARVARTVSHELGHCFGIDHCTYYACSMQASATIQEDARQPAYLCPIDQAKLLHATGGTVHDRYQALLAFLDKHKDVHMFAAYAAWIRAQLEERRV